MSVLDLGALKALAEAATPGPWVMTTQGGIESAHYRGPGEDPNSVAQTRIPENWEFIAAANPQTVLALIERVREAEAERDEGWRVAAEQTRLERARAERAEAALSGLMEQRVTRWACVVVESGYHNGARCTPDEPHADWGCGYRVALDNHGALHILSTYEKGATQ